MIKNVLLVLVSTILALLAMEGVLRGTNVAVPRLHQYELGAIVADEAIGYRLAKNHRSIMSDGYFVEELATNELGHRDIWNASLPDLGVIAIGDSQTMGHGIAARDTWVEQLQTRIGVNVVNTGVFGYGLRQFKEVLRRARARHEIRHVLYAMTFNDIRSGAEPPDNFTVVDRYLTRNPKYRHEGVPIQERAWFAYLFQTTALGLVIRDGLRTVKALFTSQSDIDAFNDALVAQSKRSMTELEVLRRYVTEIGADFTIVYISNHILSRPDIWDLYRKTHSHSRFFVPETMADWVNQHQIPFADTTLDLEQVYLASGGERTSIILATDHHFNRDGMKVISKAFESLLRENESFDKRLADVSAVN